MERRDFLKAGLGVVGAEILGNARVCKAETISDKEPIWKDSNPEIRQSVFRTLLHQKKLTKEEIFSIAQKHMDPEIRLEAFRYAYNRELLSREDATNFTKHMDPRIRIEAFSYLYNHEQLSKQEALSFTKHMDPEVRLKAFKYLHNHEQLSKQEVLSFTKHMDPEVRLEAFTYLANKNLLYKREMEELTRHYDPELRQRATQILANQTEFKTEPQPAPPPSPPKKTQPNSPIPPSSPTTAAKDNPSEKIPPWGIAIFASAAVLGLLAPLSCILSDRQILRLLNYRRKVRNPFSREEKILEDEFLRFTRSYMNQQESSHPSSLSSKIRRQRILEEIKKLHKNWIGKNGTLKDFYQILDIGQNATREEIKKAYWKMVHKTHPDLVGGNDRIIDVNLAYQVLSDPGLSSEYHKYYGELIG